MEVNSKKANVPRGVFVRILYENPELHGVKR